MQNRFVSLGIDHGTANSCVAEMTPQGPRVIPAEPGGLTLPSAVYYSSDGILSVGTAARQAIMMNSKNGQGFTGYKLHIGGDRRYEFTAARKSMTAPQLGAIVIQALLRAYYKASGIDARACVITIPAKFKQNSVVGTSEAARLAGLKYYPLIMEPVAAAMRYGFSAEEQHGSRMVFDLGSCTLDVSLVMARRGKLSVPDGGHVGDDNLGGSKFDNELATLVLSRLEYDLSGFRNNRQKYSNEWGRFLLAVEDAKIRLSSDSQAFVKMDEPLYCDDKGRDVLVRVPVTRTDYENLIRADAERAVEMCQMLLKTNRLDAKEVEKLILIGEHSQTPLIRNLLAERLGIPLEYSVDPRTAVAEGAAIYAGQVELPEALRTGAPRAVSQLVNDPRPGLRAEIEGAMVQFRDLGFDAGEEKSSAFQPSQVEAQEVSRGQAESPQSEYSLKIEYERQSPVPVYCAVGMVHGPPATGLQVEIERLDGRWQSGLINVDPAGVFVAQVVLDENGPTTLSRFRTYLLDAQGRELTRVDEPQIWYPSLGVENRLANSMRVIVGGNRTQLLFPAGAELPADGKVYLVTSEALRRGHNDVLSVTILESVTNLSGSEDELASGCLHVGTLRIEGGDERVTKDVPAGQTIEVRLKLDESRSITAVAYIPLLDEEFEAVFVGEKYPYDLKDLKPRLEDIQSSLRAIDKLQAKRPVKEVTEVLEIMRNKKLLEGLAADLERAKAGDRDCEVRAYKRIVELEGTMRALQRIQSRTPGIAIDEKRPRTK